LQFTAKPQPPKSVLPVVQKPLVADLLLGQEPLNDLLPTIPLLVNTIPNCSKVPVAIKNAELKTEFIAAAEE
jgi:hypothetical protein